VSLTRRSILLLKACLAEPENFPQAFFDFDSDDNLNQMNDGEIRLVPFLFRRLESESIKSPRLNRYKGIYAKFWYTEVMRSASRVPLREIMGDIPLLVLKGHALQRLIYDPDPIRRPSDDLDILVDPACRIEAYNRLVKKGFVPIHPYPAAAVLDLKLSLNMVRGDQSIDLHWGLYPTSLANGLFADIHSRSRVIPYDDATERTPSVNDHFLHTLIHGNSQNHISPIRWILDSALLAKHSDFSFSQTMNIASTWGWSPHVATSVTVLSEIFNLDFPLHDTHMSDQSRGLNRFDRYQETRSMADSPARAFQALTVNNPMNMQQLHPPGSGLFLSWQIRSLARWFGVRFDRE